MRKLIFLVLLTGCAAQPQEPTASQIAVVSYLAAQCGYRGSADVMQAVRSDPVLKGCVLVKAEQANAMSRRRSGFSDALQGMGQTLIQGSQSQTNCSTRPDYLGGWTTTCR